MPPPPSTKAGAYVVTADIPGVKKDRLTVRLTKAAGRAPATLTIAGGGAASASASSGGAESGAPSAPAGEPLLRERRRRGAFERRLPLPDDAADAGVTARVRDGVLTVRVPRVAARAEARESDIPVL